MEEILQKIYEYLAANGLNLIYAIVILVVGRFAAKLISKIVTKSLSKTRVDQSLQGFISSMTYFALLVFVILAVLNRLGVQTASFIAVLGAAGLAVGLALQGSLANFAAGVLLITFKPFKAGDFVEIADTKGIVRDIDIFNTTLDSPDNLRIIIPNSRITGNNIVNYTSNGTRRVDMVIGVSYDDDLQKTREVIMQVVSSDERVLAEPAPVVAVSALADSSVNFVVRPWVNAADYWKVYFDLTERIKNALDENDITIPFPQRDIHFRNAIPPLEASEV